MSTTKDQKSSPSNTPCETYQCAASGLGTHISGKSPCLFIGFKVFDTCISKNCLHYKLKPHVKSGEQCVDDLVAKLKKDQQPTLSTNQLEIDAKRSMEAVEIDKKFKDTPDELKKQLEENSEKYKKQLDEIKKELDVQVYQKLDKLLEESKTVVNKYDDESYKKVVDALTKHNAVLFSARGRGRGNGEARGRGRGRGNGEGRGNVPNTERGRGKGRGARGAARGVYSNRPQRDISTIPITIGDKGIVESFSLTNDNSYSELDEDTN
jgi:hypothetical protein